MADTTGTEIPQNQRAVSTEELMREREIIANKELRRDLDIQLQKLKSLVPSGERIESVNRLTEAIMWLGMDLKRLNEPNPYPNSKDPSNTKIEPTADGLKL